jgi:phosphoribosyl 1,2-cyclic phosphodiesterase
MLIRCWGARGSIPVSGPRFEKYGGDTTCMEIRSKRGEILIIDAGSGLRNLGYSLVKEKARKITMLFTHAHLDHLMGFPFFAPLFSSAMKLRLFGPRLNKSSFQDVMADFLDQPYFPVQLGDKDIRSKVEFVDIDVKPFTVGSFKIVPIELSHPKNGGRGYRIEEGKKSFVFLTDNELGYIHGGGRGFDDYVQFATGADLLIHDAEYTQKDYRHILAVSEQPWGHSLFTDAVNLAVEAKVRRFGLFHHNQKRTDAQVDVMVKIARTIIRRKRSTVDCFAVGSSFALNI